MTFWVIDRFEEKTAVLVDDNGKTKTVPREILPSGAEEGSVLSADGTQYALDKKETFSRRKEARKLINELFK